MGGPSFKLENVASRRRTLYAAVSRHELNSTLRLFDFPDPNLTSQRRAITTAPMQQLFVLNSEFMVRQAKALASRLLDESSADENARIALAYRLTLGRTPSERELHVGRSFLAAAPASGDLKMTAWEQYAQALLATNEFAFVD